MASRRAGERRGADMTGARFADETVDLRDGRTARVRRGGKGSSLVWLHSTAGFSPDDAFVQALASRYTVIAPIAPGFDDVGDLDGLEDVHDLALYYDDLLQAIDVDEASLVGHSFGAMVAAEIAAHVPRRVDNLVLIAPIGLWRDDAPVADFLARPYGELQDLLWADAQAREIAESAAASEDEHERLARLARGMTAVAKFLWPLPEKGLHRRLSRISARTLVVFGEHDALVPAMYADAFAEAIPNADQVVLPGAGHMVPVERAGQVTSLIDDCLMRGGA